MNLNLKLCECGCGKPAPIAKVTRKKRGQKKGCPVRFVSGHNPQGVRKERLGVRKERLGTARRKYLQDKDGRCLVDKPNHPRSHRGYVYRSILLAEKALGRSIPKGNIIHHLDGNPRIDKNNLVLCESQKYHLLLHTRLRAYKACGNPNWRKCHICKEYDAHENLVFLSNSTTAQHKKRTKNYQNNYQKLTENDRLFIQN